MHTLASSHIRVCVCVCVWERESIKTVCELVWKWKQTVNNKYQSWVSSQGRQRSSPIVRPNHWLLQNLWNIKEVTVAGATSVNEAGFKEIPVTTSGVLFKPTGSAHRSSGLDQFFQPSRLQYTRSCWNLVFYAVGDQNKCKGWKINIDLLSSVLPPGEKWFYLWKVSSC